MRLYKYLTEQEFNRGRDVDFPQNSDYVILFSKDDSYELKGNTHGLISHALKHLHEFKNSLAKTFLKKTASIILKYKDSIHLYKRGAGFVTGLPKITDAMLLATLDSVQDKVELNEPLLPPEKELYNEVLRDFATEYKNIVDNIIANSVDVTNIDSIADIVKLLQSGKYILIKYKSRDSMYISVQTRYVLITNARGKVATLYVVGNGNRALYHKVYKRDPVNTKILDALKVVLKIQS